MPTPISGRASKPGASKAKTKPQPQTVSREERQERRRAIEAEDRREWRISTSKVNPRNILLAEQIIIIADKIKNKNMFHIVIVPTAATGSSAAVKKYPKIIHFKIPKSSVQQAHLLRDAHGQPSFKNHLQPPENQEVVFHQNTRDQSLPIMFKCLATLEGENDTYVEGSEAHGTKQGSLYFLPNGILWLGANTLYFPTGSINFAMLLFARDMATTRFEKGRKTPITAMGLMIKASEPFYEGEESPRPPSLNFKSIQNYPSMRKHIEKYCEAHKIGLRLTESTYYNYQEGLPMTGWSNLDETEEPLPEADMSG
ncbi:hypothetical protein FSARC_3736, partial [Fusarium sarcochroum]